VGALPAPYRQPSQLWAWATHFERFSALLLTELA
jgi:hypothetical protein